MKVTLLLLFLILQHAKAQCSTAIETTQRAVTTSADDAHSVFAADIDGDLDLRVLFLQKLHGITM